MKAVRVELAQVGHAAPPSMAFGMAAIQSSAAGDIRRRSPLRAPSMPGVSSGMAAMSSARVAASNGATMGPYEALKGFMPYKALQGLIRRKIAL